MSLKLSVIGAGYLGAVHAACMAELGHEVVAIDTDAAKVEALAQAQPSMYEPGLAEMLERVLPTGRLTFTTDYALAADADIHFICVGTPQRKGENAADTSYVYDSAESLAPYLTRECLVVGKSTVPVGTAFHLRARLQEQSPAGQAVRLAWNPEFLREGFAIEDTLTPNRFVYGVDGPTADADVALLDECYAVPLESGIPRLVVDYSTAELVKISANAFLATKISFINAMSEVCEAAGGDVVKLAEAIGMDDRIGSKFLRAGVGFGGGCLPKDIRAFMARAGELGADQALTFLREVDAINTRRRHRMVDLPAKPAAAPCAPAASPCSVPPSSPTATTPATPPPSTSPARSRPTSPPSSSTTPRRWTTPAASPPSCSTPTPRKTRSAGRTSCSTSPSGPNTAPSTPPPCATSSSGP